MTNQASRKMTQATDWNWTNTLNYTRTFNQKHNLTAMVGFTAEKFADYWVFGSREAIPSNNEASTKCMPVRSTRTLTVTPPITRWCHISDV